MNPSKRARLVHSPILAWAMCIAFMGVIFFMSAMPGDVSSQQSGFVVRLLTALYAFLTRRAPSAQLLGALELLVRKGAHMTEYAILALLYARALRLSGARRPALTALVLSALYAATDETHQCFVAGRGPSPIDVLIDTAGAAAGLLLLRAWTALRARRPRA